MARLKVHTIPGARSDEVVGWHGDALRVRVRARPEKGRANQALLELLARHLGVAPAALAIAHGARSRDKMLQVDGLSEEQLRRKLGPPAR